jgi:predicted metal-dependent hydrolase
MQSFSYLDSCDYVMNEQRETRVFHEDAFHLEYTITRTRRRTIGITIRPDASVVVRVPKHVSQRQVDDVLGSKKGWIQEKRESIKARELARPKPPAFADGEAIPYRGKTLTLAIRQSLAKRARVEYMDGSLVVDVPRELGPSVDVHGLVKATVVAWYKVQSRALLPARVEVFKPVVGVNPVRVTVKNQSTRWGSCSSRGNVNLNWRLILCPPAVLDYVIIHELCHLKIHSHSPAFWQLVAAFVPDYKACKQWLDASAYLRDF